MLTARHYLYMMVHFQPRDLSACLMVAGDQGWVRSGGCKPGGTGRTSEKLSLSSGEVQHAHALIYIRWQLQFPVHYLHANNGGMTLHFCAGITPETTKACNTNRPITVYVYYNHVWSDINGQCAIIAIYFFNCKLLCSAFSLLRHKRQFRNIKLISVV